MTDPLTDRPGWDDDGALDELLAETREERQHEETARVEPSSEEPWPWWWH
ncbi:hypothetical protein [Labedaea rhizosphaerae]|uniref:Uncharacterized protein n=1 Tax=Labedaea rhizosphaerae TaxID=598644 RepID=A0A4R6SDG6_LABRH|nr:hypothetical protein [Labedaea rhizosphaerae]TDP97673.1 hypothetical protein EV186_103637 [Labedaea rhizosphaerae]